MCFPISRLEERSKELKDRIQALDRSIEESHTEPPAIVENNVRTIYTNSDIVIDLAIMDDTDKEAAVAVIVGLPRSRFFMVTDFNQVKAKGILSELVTEMQAAIDKKRLASSWRIRVFSKWIPNATIKSEHGEKNAGYPDHVGGSRSGGPRGATAAGIKKSLASSLSKTKIISLLGLKVLHSPEFSLSDTLGWAAFITWYYQ
ncbi:hypothetical protein W97_05214 [Coniosporium apollinis CBS 100218]|uniref:Uncharacterized protein n=1 Tax=Coniosporium apollinis (strain CBS 100218) TaxID=1168221 RepID=R7YVP6_CONA1|nr:uncharacterized protein W97_05214 [Coniosporium apollinis CBS 100218]EON65972.1 hypothetical protein W97_05214 [Coniosporium apollinis CBS 100218]